MLTHPECTVDENPQSFFCPATAEPRHPDLFQLGSGAPRSRPDFQIYPLYPYKAALWCLLESRGKVLTIPSSFVQSVKGVTLIHTNSLLSQILLSNSVRI